MTALTVRLPNSVHEKIKELAEREDISVNQFIASAAAEKMASVMTLDYLKSEGSRGSTRCASCLTSRFARMRTGTSALPVVGRVLTRHGGQIV